MILAIHLRRPRHRRLMTEASIQVLASKMHVDRANRSGDPTQGVMGWHRLQAAVRAVVECRCPRDQWPLNVQEAIPSD